MASDGVDPAAVRGAGDLAAHGALLAAGAGAMVLRIAAYGGPPRRWREVLLDGLVMMLVGFGVGEMALWLTDDPHAAIGCGVMSGLVGWEAVKQIAAKKLAKGKAP